MATNDHEWRVLPHGPIEPLAENLWRVEGDLPGMALRRVMAVARLASGALVLHSAIALDEEGMRGLEALGRPAWLCVPNGWHRLDAARYKARYPELRVICPAGSKRRVAQRVAVDTTYRETPRPVPGDDSVSFEGFGDERQVEGVMRVRSADGDTLVFGDSLFNLPHGRGLFWFIYGRLLGATGGPKVTPIGRLFLLGGGVRGSYRDWLRHAAADEAIRLLVPGHGGVVHEDARGTLGRVADSL